ncbi:dUTP diphosphatase [Pseudodesulfovibrio sediminis]|uniref:dUTP diphosphatase n=1 Tax=Pseudodesulfovibrio sediminis TaxID=2810563 RepID=A0ABM7P2Y8_9BACT|nr:dUTP diphosphatase [Pseudodesulfovibrio sediminis]BCS87204.1 deoxyuridine 5'-triphosphate nucleotidohydrolase [Pseudodesulfovibrio sediminis]
MNKINVNMKFLHPVWEEHKLAYATEYSAGLDLRACLDVDEIEIGPGEKAAIPAGVAIEIHEPSIAGYVFSRSGLGTKDGLTVSQGVGVIDPDYRGEIKVSLLNTSDQVRRIKRGQRIAQLVFMPIFQANILPMDELGETDRGAGGFGSTGKH